jgi:hypothetical protein
MRGRGAYSHMRLGGTVVVLCLMSLVWAFVGVFILALSGAFYDPS